MALMKRANREIIVPEHLVGEYLDKGYSLIDDHGTILQASNPQNVNDYRTLVAALKEKIAGLEKKIAVLQHTNASASEAEANADDGEGKKTDEAEGKKATAKAAKS